jgi:hypothetical protein
MSSPRTDLASVLAAAIAAIRVEHEEGCDLDHPGTPAASVCLLKPARRLDRGDRLDVMTDDGSHARSPMCAAPRCLPATSVLRNTPHPKGRVRDSGRSVL